MAKRWKKEEVTYLKRYAKQRTLEELAARFRIEAEAIEAKLSELGLKTSDGMGKINLADDPLVRVYERGIKAAHGGDWVEAKKHLERVAAESDLSDVVQRALQYLALCERHLEKVEATDPYLEALVLSNEGELDAAEALVRQAGRVDEDERFAYLGAAIAARLEDYALAASRLETAIRLNPRNRIQAAEDLDFAAVRNEPDFAELLL